MGAQRIQLQNGDGSHSKWIGERELKDLLQKQAVTKITNKRDVIQAYRFRALPVASESRGSAGSLTRHDEFALVGIHRVDETWVERLIGFGLLPSGTAIPNCGFLDCIGVKCHHRRMLEVA